MLSTPQVFLLLALLLPPAFTQQSPPSPDEIDFRALPDWLDYRECVRQCFYYCVPLDLSPGGESCNNQVAGNLGCKTNKCLCSRIIVFRLGVAAAERCARECTAFIEEDAEEARRAVAEYCGLRGYFYDPLGTDESPSLATSTTSTTATSATFPEESPPSPLTATVATTIPTPTEVTTAPDPGPTPGPTTSTTSTDQPNPDSAGAKKSDFGTSEIIGTVIGIVGLFVAVLTLYFTWKKRRERQHLRSLQGAGSSYGVRSE